MNQILECVPNFSEGRDLSVIEKLCDCFRGKPGVRLLDYTWDQDHNRCVLTIIGEPEPLRDAVVSPLFYLFLGTLARASRRAKSHMSPDQAA